MADLHPTVACEESTEIVGIDRRQDEAAEIVCCGVGLMDLRLAVAQALYGPLL
jgi:hypothetical protein